MHVLSDTENSASESDISGVLQALEREGRKVKALPEKVSRYGAVTTWSRDHGRASHSIGTSKVAQVVAWLTPVVDDTLIAADNQSTLQGRLETSLAETQRYSAPIPNADEITRYKDIDPQLPRLIWESARNEQKHMEARIAKLEQAISKILGQIRHAQSTLDSNLAADDDVIFGLPDEWLRNSRRVKIKRARAEDVISFYADDDESE